MQQKKVCLDSGFFSSQHQRHQFRCCKSCFFFFFSGTSSENSRLVCRTPSFRQKSYHRVPAGRKCLPFSSHRKNTVIKIVFRLWRDKVFFALLVLRRWSKYFLSWICCWNICNHYLHGNFNSILMKNFSFPTNFWRFFLTFANSFFVICSSRFRFGELGYFLRLGVKAVGEPHMLNTSTSCDEFKDVAEVSSSDIFAVCFVLWLWFFPQNHECFLFKESYESEQITNSTLESVEKAVPKRAVPFGFLFVYFAHFWNSRFLVFFRLPQYR